MVSKSGMDPENPIDPARLGKRLAATPGLAALREALAGAPAFLVGGVVRDLLLNLPRVDVDVAVEGDAAALARSLDSDARVHDRFGTATVDIEGLRVDLAATRSERYPHPGALPEVAPAGLAEDLARRDFTVNAMALPLSGEPELIDPHDGLGDLREGQLAVLHDASFRDDPTRALRAARYCARLGLQLEQQTASLLAEADLATVSADRVEAELRRAAQEPRPSAVFELLARWRLAGVDSGAPARVEAITATLAQPGWDGVIDRTDAIVGAAVLDPTLESAALRLASAQPARPSEGVELARGRSPLELVAARTAGARWLDDYVREWRDVGLEIDGQDLLAEGVPEGPALGRGLAAALTAKLDGQVAGRADELRIAVEAARG